MSRHRWLTTEERAATMAAWRQSIPGYPDRWNQALAITELLPGCCAVEPALRGYDLPAKYGRPRTRWVHSGTLRPLLGWWSSLHDTAHIGGRGFRTDEFIGTTWAGSYSEFGLTDGGLLLHLPDAATYKRVQRRLAAHRGVRADEHSLATAEGWGVWRGQMIAVAEQAGATYWADLAHGDLLTADPRPSDYARRSGRALAAHAQMAVPS